MKKALLFFLLFIGGTCIHAQVSPTSFPADSAQWLHEYYGYPNMGATSPGDYFDTLYFFTMQNDTTIASVNYKKLTEFTLGFHTGTWNLAMPLTYIGALRFDSSSQRLYLVKAGTTTEILAYKFGLTTGDNYVTPYTTLTTMDSSIVNVSDSVMQFRPYPPSSPTFNRTVHLLYHQQCGWPSPDGPNAILNNIGSSYGFLQALCPTETNEHILRSFSDLGAGDPYSFHTMSILNKIDELNGKPRIEIAPNPVGDFCSIQIEGTNNHGQTRIRIFNSSGQLVLQRVCVENNVTLSTEKLSPGLYLVEVTSGGSVVRSKLIKN